MFRRRDREGINVYRSTEVYGEGNRQSHSGASLALFSQVCGFRSCHHFELLKVDRKLQKTHFGLILKEVPFTNQITQLNQEREEAICSYTVVNNTLVEHSPRH
jgi:hypothetical protein